MPLLKNAVFQIGSFNVKIIIIKRSEFILKFDQSGLKYLLIHIQIVYCLDFCK